MIRARHVLFSMLFTIFGTILLITNTKEQLFSLTLWHVGICSEIKSIRAEGMRVVIEFNRMFKDLKKYTSSFGYETSAYGSLLVFPPNTSRYVESNRNTLVIEFDSPFIQEYEGNLVCLNIDEYKPNFLQSPESIIPQADAVFPLRLKASEFSNRTNTSQMECFGDTPETRYCHAKNVAMYKDMIIFTTSADYAFPTPFLVLGGRAPPYDVPADRLNQMPVVSKLSPLEINPSIEHVRNQSFLFSRFWNSHMPWHALFDDLIPLAYTINEIDKNNTNKDERRIFYRDLQSNAFNSYYKGLSQYPIEMFNMFTAKYFDDLYLGLIKLEDNPSNNRNTNEQHAFKYNMDNTTVPWLKKAVLDGNGVDVRANRTTVIFTQRKKKRKILNQKEVISVMKEECPFCTIKIVEYSNYPVIEQMKLTASAGVIVGAHGSALSNSFWLPDGSYLFEILPYGYICRNWYQTEALVANLHYVKIFGVSNVTSSSLEKCTKNKELCSTFMCHDIIRDQDITVPIEEFRMKWRDIVRNL